MPRCLLFLLFALAEFAVGFREVSVHDHGKVVHFYRFRNLWGIFKIPYIHKAIILHPSVGDYADVKTFKGEPLGGEKPYVIHMWSSSSDTSKAVVRVDPLEDIIQDSRYDIMPDSEECFDPLTCVHRALTQLGRPHRGVKYSLWGNNCGHFATWAKLGCSEIDTQFWDSVKTYMKNWKLAFVNRFIDFIQARSQASFRALEDRLFLIV
jgi:hypothetical protein